MSTWHYEAGQWTETTFIDDIWEGAADWDQTVKRHGFEQLTAIGGTDRHAAEIAIYRRETTPRFIVTYSDYVIVESMTADRLPDALDLMARYAPILTAAEISDAIHDIRAMEEFGIVTDLLAGMQVNERAVTGAVSRERQERSERRRKMREREGARQ